LQLQHLLAWTKKFLTIPRPSLCKSLIRKLLIKDELRRLGSRAGASDVKAHPFFKPTSWALLRHMKPPIIPNAGRGIDTVNFRNVKESKDQPSMDLGHGLGKSNGTTVLVNKGLGVPASNMKGVPLDSNLETPRGEIADPFEEFNSVTLHHEGDDEEHLHLAQQREQQQRQQQQSEGAGTPGRAR
jgi:protein-serine/threonine kinase